MEKNLVRDSMAELIGTFMLVLVGAGAGILTQSLQAAALAHGLILIGIIYTYGHISGAHVNPAVTAGLLAGRHISLRRASFYWVVQLTGAALASFFLVSFKAIDVFASDNKLQESVFTLGQTTGLLTANYLPSAMLFEGIMTFFLVSVVIQAAVFGRAGNMAGLCIGFLLAACILFGGTITGASLNPARTFGPALVAGQLFTYGIPYMVAIMIGGGLAGYVQTTFFKPEPLSEVPTSSRNKKNR